MKKSVTALLVASTLSFTPAVFAEGAFDADNFSANIAVTTNYIFRGVSLSGDNGAVSGGFDWGYNGFYVGTWASSIDQVETESFEIDYYAGYVGEVGGFSYSLDVIYYDYPGQADSGDAEDIGDLDYVEYGGSIAYTFDTDMSPTIGALIMHSSDFYAESGSATAYEGFLELSLPYDLGLGMYVGEQDLDKDKNFGISSYTYYGVNLSKTIGKFDFTLGYSDTTDAGEKWIGDNNSELVFTIGASI